MDSAFCYYTSIIKTQKFPSIDATCAFFRYKRGRPEQLLPMAFSDGQRCAQLFAGDHQSSVGGRAVSVAHKQLPV